MYNFSLGCRQVFCLSVSACGCPKPAPQRECTTKRYSQYTIYCDGFRVFHITLEKSTILPTPPFAVGTPPATPAICRIRHYSAPPIVFPLPPSAHKSITSCDQAFGKSNKLQAAKKASTEEVVAMDHNVDKNCKRVDFSCFAL